ncbi:type I restriction endonuclease subunit R [Campylobacter canadensis]|uniref:type I restriction endonuclease subunit R n=1 Tax=Campylobacter canadensis TaxID=449520 RepID=UPI0015537E4B|nr:DEAD/DEAH box helicase family protein [Campylobacter canadensis]MBZ7995063.1 type I restriction endonuclease subunit R [Campylobacter canadensis]MBZ7996661.1 type I restriction endonuclease subunit R [Campylobacter canadensis]MBZ8003404.1 type I restriction endonuclease subunit R [Campylobacter canadensis]
MRKYTEKDLETFIENHLLSNGYIKRQSDDYDKNYGVDTQILFEFLKSTQLKSLNDLALRVGENNVKEKLLKRLSSECDKKGTLEVLKNGFSENGIKFSLLYPKPNNSLNQTADYNYSCNKFCVIRQLYFSNQTSESIDIVIFINGLSVATIELKNPFTNQNTQNARFQYTKRNPNETIFKRSIVHFALDSESAYMSTKLERENTKFLPFNKGLNDGLAGIGVQTGAGNPPSDGIKTAYLWERILSKEVLLDIILKYIQIIKKDDKNVVIFPRYHQFDVVDKLLKDCYDKGVGQRYLIQHSAGSGKSNSISWLALNLVELHKDDKPIFDSVIVITDRKVLDRQIRDNLKSFEHKGGVIEAITDGSKHLKEALINGKKIIITTIQKFPYIADSITSLDGKTFAVIIDEAHSSQDGQMSSKLSESIKEKSIKADNFDEVLEEIANNKKLQSNATYFAFTATPKPKTLEKFGSACMVEEEKKFFPYHLYSMKQAIEEGYILDVLKGYVTYESFYKLLVATKGDKKYDEKKAKAKLKKFVESSKITIEKKADIICEHFYTQIAMKIDGKAKAMVVTNSRQSALNYYFAISKILKSYHPTYKALVAFSGELEVDGVKYTESSVNNISEAELKKEFKKDIYRFLIVAEKYQTGFDEPLLHTMYVDKPLDGISAVQTLSRLNRVCKNKYSTCVVDFANTHEDIAEAFSKFYENSYLENESDPNKIFDLKDSIKSFMFFSDDEVDEFVRYVLEEKSENYIHSYLDMITYRINESNEDTKFEFYQKCKNYIKSYEFLSQILPYADIELEKIYIFLPKLISKINLSKIQLEKDLLANVDFDSYRVQLKAKMDIKLSSDGGFYPSNADGSKQKSEIVLDELANIVRSFNEKYGNFEFDSNDKIKRYLTSLKDDVLEDKSFLKSLQNYDRQNTKIAFNEILPKAILNKCDTNFAFYTSYCNDKDFQIIMSEKIYEYIVEEYRKSL